ncbi:non-homologous end joining protein Ku [Streptomyces malaysiensis]|uniref:non-homologous end joining protein Ku n=1 Tax=Streptomyces malaysiensis TaxID=92644 RepID=UPI00368866A4
MRAIWSGTISFGLVALPCQLYTATEESGPGLHTVHVACGGRVRHRRFCELENVEVPQAEIARAWEAPDGRQVILRDTDLEALPLPTKHIIEVLGFVGAEEVDPILYSRPYWIGATGAGAQRPYALLVEALSRSGRLAICKVAIRSRERLAALRPRRGMLLLQTLLWPEELRDPGDLSSTSPLTDRELEMAEVLMDALAGVDISELHDEYTAALTSLVDAKASGGELAVRPEPAPAVDLMAALEASVQAAKRAREDGNEEPP